MAAIAPLSIADGAATPITRTFGPVNVDSAGIARWAERSGGIAIGFPQINLGLRIPNKGNRNYKITARVVLPVLEVTSPSTSTGIQPAPTKAYDLAANIEVIMPERSTLLERDHMRAFMKNFLASTQFQTAMQNFEPVF